MKELKFAPRPAVHVLKAVLDGDDFITIRIGDEKNIGAGDVIDAVLSDTGEPLCVLVVTSTFELRASDAFRYADEHEARYLHDGWYSFAEAMDGYYGDQWFGGETPVKAITLRKAMDTERDP